jgi:hypothetical protein
VGVVARGHGDAVDCHGMRGTRIDSRDERERRCRDGEGDIVKCKC